MSFVAGLTLLLGFYLLGEGAAALLPAVPLTGSLWGMLLLFLALLSGAVRQEWIRDAADALVSLMGLLFVPVGVGILAYEDLVRADAAAIAAAIALGSVLTLLVAGGVAWWLGRSS